MRIKNNFNIISTSRKRCKHMNIYEALNNGITIKAFGTYNSVQGFTYICIYMIAS